MKKKLNFIETKENRTKKTKLKRFKKINSYLNFISSNDIIGLKKFSNNKLV